MIVVERPSTASRIVDGIGYRDLRWGAGLLAGSTVASFLGLATVVHLAFPLLAAGLAAVLLLRRQHAAYLHLVLFLWFFSSGLRRVVDFQTSYHETSPVLLAAPVASVFGVLFCAVRRTRLPGPFLAFLTVFGLAMGYAFVVGLVNVGPVPVLASFAAWGPPFLIGLYLAFLPVPATPLVRSLGTTSWVYVAVLGGYGVIQWAIAPGWDTAWMKAIYTADFSFGTDEPFGIRVFSLVNSPYTLGCVLVVLLAVQFTCPLTPARVISIVLGVGALGLSGVRAAWIVLAVLVVLLTVRGRVNPRTALLATAGIVAAVAFAPATFAQTVGDRLDSLGSGSNDVSYAARNQFYATVLPRLFADPTGSGFGSTGAGVRAGGAGADGQWENVDSAYLDMLRTFGPWFAILVVIMLLGVVGWLWWRLGGARDQPFAGWTSFLAAVPLLAVLGDIWGGAVGLVVWIGLAASARRLVEEPGTAADHEPRADAVHSMLGLGAVAATVVLALVLADQIVPVTSTAAPSVGPCQAVRRDVAATHPETPVGGPGSVAVIVGDSWTQGTFLADPRTQGWAPRVGTAMGWTTYLDGVGGTGFVNPGFCSGQTYADRVPTILAHRPDVVIIEGGLNDTGYDPSRVRQAATDLLRRLAGVRRVIVVGPADAPSQPVAPTVDRELSAATVAAGRQYVSTIGETYPYLTDRLHLTGPGHEEFAQDVTTAIRRTR